MSVANREAVGPALRSDKHSTRIRQITEARRLALRPERERLQEQRDAEERDVREAARLDFEIRYEDGIPLETYQHHLLKYLEHQRNTF